ncbi:Acetylcholine receptor subunit alpha-type unc-38 [Aphelenchoides fujianensis]|nr:Acetylcholine receptor subunit alpha-type unc-38 [Aphelenchoides fujianensis]
MKAAGVIALSASVLVVVGTQDSKRLFDDLLADYSPHRRPALAPDRPTVVHVRLSLSQLVDVDELNQVMICSVWLRQTWVDPRLRWSPAEYGEVDVLHVPAELIWTPDLVLYNAESSFNVTISTKATVHADGRVIFEPPAVARSTCLIDVRFFPFDDQLCALKFGSWNHAEERVDLRLLDGGGRDESEQGVDLSDYYPSVEWDLMTLRAVRSARKYRTGGGPFVDVTFELGLRRKSLFYTLNLLLPCVSMAALTLLVFSLPSESGEKIQLAISILVSVVFFFLLLTEMLPASGFFLPLIAKYLLFTMLLASASVFTEIFVLNLHFRKMTTHSMGRFTRWLLLGRLPPLLGLRKHKTARKAEEEDEREHPTVHVHLQRAEAANFRGRNAITRAGLSRQLCRELAGAPMDARLRRLYYSPLVIKAIENIDFIGQVLRRKHTDAEAEGEWEFAAAVLDRLFLWIFGPICVLGTLWIFAQAPLFYDRRLPYDAEAAPAIHPLEELAWEMGNLSLV